MLPLALLQRASYKGAERHARHLQRVLEGEEYAALGALVHGKRGYVRAVENDAAACDGIFGIARDGIAQRGLACAVRPHEHVRLIRAESKINAAQYLLFTGADVKVLYFKQFFLFHCFRPFSAQPHTWPRR